MRSKHHSWRLQACKGARNALEIFPSFLRFYHIEIKHPRERLEEGIRAGKPSKSSIVCREPFTRMGRPHWRGIKMFKVVMMSSRFLKFPELSSKSDPGSRSSCRRQGARKMNFWTLPICIQRILPIIQSITRVMAHRLIINALQSRLCPRSIPRCRMSSRSSVVISTTPEIIQTRNNSSTRRSHHL